MLEPAPEGINEPKGLCPPSAAAGQIPASEAPAASVAVCRHLVRIGDVMKHDGLYLTGHNALVTGGASGIGRAIAMGLARAGANVAVGSLTDDLKPLVRGEATHLPSMEDLAAVEAEIAACGVGALACSVDVADTKAVETMVASARTALGTIDILVNAAGTNATCRVVDESDAVWERLLQVNLVGQFRTIRACMPDMLRQRWGRIVNVSSTAGLEGHEGNAAYCASKAGVLGLTRCVAFEGARHNVTCNAICPGWVQTDGCVGYVEAELAMNGDTSTTVDAFLDGLVQKDVPIGRMIRPEEPAALAVFLCSDASGALTGEVIRMSGGARW